MEKGLERSPLQRREIGWKWCFLLAR